METTQMSISGWMNKTIELFTYSGILFSHKQLWEVLIQATIWKNLETIMLNKRSHKKHVVYDSIPMNSSKQENLYT